MSWKKLISAMSSGVDVAGSIEDIADAFDMLAGGIEGFSRAANDSDDNYTKLLNGMTEMGRAIGELDKMSKTLFGSSSKLGAGFGGILKPLRLISQSVSSFAQAQRIFAEAASAVDMLSAGVRQTNSEFFLLTNTFGGTYDDATCSKGSPNKYLLAKNPY